MVVCCCGGSGVGGGGFSSGVDGCCCESSSGGVCGTIMEGVMRESSSSMSSSSPSARASSTCGSASSGGAGPRSSRRRFPKSIEASFKAAMSFLPSVHCSNPKAHLSCSAVTKMLLPPLRTHACLPTPEGSQDRKVPAIHVPRFFPPLRAHRQKATRCPGSTSATLVLRVLRKSARRRCRLQSMQVVDRFDGFSSNKFSSIGKVFFSKASCRW